MDFSNIINDMLQDVRTAELRESVKQLEAERMLDDGDRRTTKELAEENRELKLRLGLLIRLLVSKNVISAEEYAAQLAEARPKRPPDYRLKP